MSVHQRELSFNPQISQLHPVSTVSENKNLFVLLEMESGDETSCEAILLAGAAAVCLRRQKQTAVASAIAAITLLIVNQKRLRKSRVRNGGRYRRAKALHLPAKSFRRRVDKKGDLSEDTNTVLKDTSTVQDDRIGMTVIVRKQNSDRLLLGTENHAADKQQSPRSDYVGAYPVAEMENRNRQDETSNEEG